MVLLSVAYPFAPLGATAVGGAEQVLTTIEAGLVDHGIRSIVVANAESSIAGRLLSVSVPPGVLTLDRTAHVQHQTQLRIDQAFASFDIDLVHMHGIDFYPYRIPGDCPVLITLHLPLDWYPSQIWELPSRYRLLCVSQTQKLNAPRSAQARLTVLPNGVPIPDLSLLQHAIADQEYAVMLSRICPEKNLHVGIDASRAAGLPVVLAGQVFPYPEHLKYFADYIQPRLGSEVRLIPPVGGIDKARLLARAKCLLLPTLAPETSSLVAMESMASGTPVVAMCSGALPEIVEKDQTGFLVSDGEEMAAAISKVNKISRAYCRHRAVQRFTSQAMLRRYVDLYRALAA